MDFYSGFTQKGDILVADIEELEILDASETHARRLNVKGVITPKSGEHFIFPIADGNSQVVWKRAGLQKNHLNPGSPCTKRRP